MSRTAPLYLCAMALPFSNTARQGRWSLRCVNSRHHPDTNLSFAFVVFSANPPPIYTDSLHLQPRIPFTCFAYNSRNANGKGVYCYYFFKVPTTTLPPSCISYRYAGPLANATRDGGWGAGTAAVFALKVLSPRVLPSLSIASVARQGPVPSPPLGGLHRRKSPEGSARFHRPRVTVPRCWRRERIWRTGCSQVPA